MKMGYETRLGFGWRAFEYCISNETTFSRNEQGQGWSLSRLKFAEDAESSLAMVDLMDNLN